MIDGKIPFNGDYPVKENPTLLDRMFVWSQAENKNRAVEIGNLQSLLVQGETSIQNPGNFTRNSETSWSISGASFTVLGTSYSGVSKTFSPTLGDPSAGNARWELYYGDVNGDITYLAGTEAATPVKPVPPADTVILREVLRLDDGDWQQSTTGSQFPDSRFASRVTASATDDYAKIMQFTGTAQNTYSFSLVYSTFASSTEVGLGRATGILNVSMLFNGSSELEWASMETINYRSNHGDFVLLETSPGVVELFHKATAYWDRIQFRAVLTNTSVSASAFLSDNPYLSLPGGALQQWDSIAGHLPIPSTGTEIKFDHDRVYGTNGAPLSDNLTDTNTSAKIGITATIFHAAGTEPTYPASWGTPAGYSTTETNIIKVTYYENGFKSVDIKQYA